SHAQALVGMLEEHPSLMARVQAAVRSGGRRWNLRMDNGIDVRLPETDAFAAWDRLAKYEAQHKLLTRDIGSIDLRLPDRVVVKVRPENGERNPEEGRQT
ncbi:MAG: Cell division protein FtsQ, partial [Alphaproteobacteria bacterium MarineAlpha4_Bin2]